MTEQEWLACKDPSEMLNWLGGPRPGGVTGVDGTPYAFKVTDRKLRLFACACCRRIWHQLTDERSRAAVEAAERYADLLITQEELAAARDAAWYAARYAAWDAAWDAAWYAAWDAARDAASAAARYAQADLLRHIMGNPFRPFVVPESQQTLEGCELPVVMAKIIYEDRRWEDMPILADALEDADCTNQEILSHLRSPGPHARGCWVIDLLLSKE